IATSAIASTPTSRRRSARATDHASGASTSAAPAAQTASAASGWPASRIAPPAAMPASAASAGARSLIALPALQALRARPRAKADPGIDGDAPLLRRDHRVEIELLRLRQLLGEAGKPKDEVDERLRVGRRRAAKAGDEPACLAGVDELLGVHVGQRRDPERRCADQLGENAAGPERDEGAEHRVLDD